MMMQLFQHICGYMLRLSVTQRAHSVVKKVLAVSLLLPIVAFATPTISTNGNNTTFLPGTTVQLTYTIVNDPGYPAQSGMDFLNTLPIDVTVVGLVSNTCGGTVAVSVAGVNPGTVQLSGGAMSAGTGSCAIVVDVTSTVLGTYVNDASRYTGLSSNLVLSSTNYVTFNVSQISIVTQIGLTAGSLSFGMTVVPSAAVVLRIRTILNGVTNQPYTIDFTETLPTNITVSSPGTQAMCGGTLVTTASTIKLMGGSVAANGQCIVDINISSAAVGTYPLNCSTFSPLPSHLNCPTGATLTVVNASYPVTKAFSSSSMTVGTTNTLTYTIQNNVTGNGANAPGTLQDTLPSGLVYASPLTVGGTCTSTVGSVNGTSTVFTASNFVVPAAPSSCTISVLVTTAASPTIGVCPQANNTNGPSNMALSSDLVNNVTGQCVSIVASTAIGLATSKAVSDPVLLPGGTGQTYTLTIAVSNGPTTAPITITDALPTGITTSGAITATGGFLSGCPASGANNLTGCQIAAGAATGNIVITVPIAVAGTATTGNNTFTATGGGAPLCTGAPNCTASVTAAIFKANDDAVTTNLGSTPGTYPVNTNDVVATGAIFSLAAGSTCASPAVSAAGLASYISPASTGTCTVKYQMCVGSICSSAVLTVTLSGAISSPNLTLNKIFNQNLIVVGQSAQYYTLTIDVTSNSTSNPITITDNLPAGMTIAAPGVTATGATLTGCPNIGASNLNTCQLASPIAVGTQVVITVPVDVASNVSSSINTASIVSVGTNCLAISPCIASTASLQVLDARDDTNSAAAGSTVVTPVSGNDTYQAGYTFTILTGPATTCVGGSLAMAGNVANISYTMPLAATSGCAIQYQVCATPPNQALCDTAILNIFLNKPLATVSKAGSALVYLVGGTNQFFTITINITGTPTVGPLQVIDNLPVGMTLSGPISIVNGTLTGSCLSTGATSLGNNCFIATGAFGTVTITVPVNVSNVPGVIVNIKNYAYIGGGGTSCDIATLNCPSNVALLIYDAVDDTVVTTPSTTINYDVTVNDLTDLATFAIVPAGTTCVGATIDPSTGIVTYTSPASGPSCTVQYSMCGPFTASGICDTAVLTVSLIDAVVDVATVLPATLGSTLVGGNDTFPNNSTFPTNSTFTVIAGGTCTGAGPASPTTNNTGLLTYNTPAVAGASCTVKYQLCAPAPNNTICDTATLTVNATAAPSYTVTKTASSDVFVVGASGQSYTLELTISNGPTTAPITITDTLPTGITTSGAITTSSGTLSGCPAAGASSLGASCQLSSALATGIVTITIPVNVATGTASGTNTAFASGGGSTLCTTGSPCSAITHTVRILDALPDTVTVLPGISTTTAVGGNDTFPNNSTFPTSSTFTVIGGTCTGASPASPATNNTGILTYNTPAVAGASCTVNYQLCAPAPNNTICDTEVLTVKTVQPVVQITKGSSSNVFVVGASGQSYTLNITISSASTTAPILITDTLPSGVTLGGAVTASGTGTLSGCLAGNTNTLSGCQIDTGATVGTVTVTIPVNVAAGTTSGTNIASVTGGGSACTVPAPCSATTGSIPILDAVPDTVIVLPGISTTTTVGGNDTFPNNSTFPTNSTFTVIGGTCTGTSPATNNTGVLGYNTPAVAGASCTVNYQLCAPAPNNTICDTAVLTVNTVQPVVQITKGSSSNVFVVGASGQSYTLNITISSASTTAPILITDTLPSGVTLGGAVTASGTGTLSGCLAGNTNTLSGCQIDTGATVGTVTVTIPVNVAAGTTSGTNTASVTGGGSACTVPAPCSATTGSIPILDAVPDTVIVLPGISTTTAVGGNDTFPNNSTFPTSSTFTVIGGTCTGASPASPATNNTGILTYNTPAVAGASCTVDYRLCAPAPNNTICDTEVLTVKTVQPVVNVSKTANNAGSQNVPVFVVNVPGQYYQLTIVISGASTTAPIFLNDNLPSGLTLSGPVTASGTGTLSGCLAGNTNTLTGCQINTGATVGTVTVTIPVNVAAGTTNAQNTASVTGGGSSCTVLNPCVAVTPPVGVIDAVDDAASVLPGASSSFIVSTNDTFFAGVSFNFVFTNCTSASIATVAGVTTISYTTPASPSTGCYVRYEICAPAPNQSLCDNANLNIDTTAPFVTLSKTSAPAFVVGATGQFYTVVVDISVAPVTSPIQLVDALPTGMTLSGPITITGGTFSGTCPGIGATPWAGATSLGNNCFVNSATVGTITVVIPVNVSTAVTSGTNQVDMYNASIACTAPLSATCSAGVKALILDAVNDSAFSAPGVNVNLDVSINDVVSGGTFAILPASTTCIGSSINPATGLMDATAPAAIGASCIVVYQLCGPGGASGICDTATVTITTGVNSDLSIQKNGPSMVANNGTVMYNLIVRNAGPYDVTNIQVVDTVPAALTAVTTTCNTTSAGAVCPAVIPAGNAINVAIPVLPVGGVVTFVVTGTAPATGLSTITNTASLVLPTGVTDPNLSNNSSSVTTQIVPVMPKQLDLSILKSAPSTVPSGTTINYLLTVTNAGPGSGDGALIQDTLPSGLSGITAICVSATGGATCSAPTVVGSTFNANVVVFPPNATVTYSVTATVTVATGILTNTATVTAPAGTVELNLANNSSTVSTLVDNIKGITNLYSIKTGPTTVAVNGVLTYTIVVGNSGPVNYQAASNAVLTDVLPAGILMTATCAVGSGTAVCPVLSATPSNTFSVLIPGASLRVGDSLIFTLTGTAPALPTTLSNVSNITLPLSYVDSNPIDDIGGPVITQVVGASGVSGTVWQDLNRNGAIDSGEPLMAGITVTLRNSTGAVVGSAVTNSNGYYLINNVPPGVGYTATFTYGNNVQGIVSPTGTAIDPLSGNPIAFETIGGITVIANNITLNQNARIVDPSGAVYDSVTRQPLAGATVTFIGPNGLPVPNWSAGCSNCLAPFSPNAQVTTATGVYSFFLAAGPTGIYRFTVAPPSGYSAPNASLGGVPSPVAGGCTVPAAPGTLLVQPQIAPPAIGVNGAAALGSPGAQYCMQLNNFGLAVQDVVNNHIPLDPVSSVGMRIEKVASRAVVELGDSVTYTLKVSRPTGAGATLANFVVVDSLPAGFSYVPNTFTVNGVLVSDALAGLTGQGNNPIMNMAINAPLATGGLVTITYRVRVGVGSIEGTGINRAIAKVTLTTDCVAQPLQCSNEGQARVRVTAGVFTTEACIIGKVYTDCNQNWMQDDEEIGIPGVRLLLLDGTSIITDIEGKYSICGLRPQTHTVKIDRSTMPKGSVFGLTANRNAMDGGSMFADLKKGELFRADFTESTCKPGVMEQIKARRVRGEVRAVDSQKNNQGTPLIVKPIMNTAPTADFVVTPTPSAQ